MPLPSLFSCMFVMGCWHFKSTIQYVSMANQNLQSPEGKTQTRDRSHEHVWKKLSSSSWWLTRSNQLCLTTLFSQHISTHTGLKSNNVSSPPLKRKRRTLSDLATTAFAVKPKKIKKLQHSALCMPRHQQQQTAVNGSRRRPAHILTCSCTSQWTASHCPADLLEPCKCMFPWYWLGHQGMGRTAWESVALVLRAGPPPAFWQPPSCPLACHPAKMPLLQE